jgi:hypothetical protein
MPNFLKKPDAGKPPVRFDKGRSETVIGLVPLQPVLSAYSTDGLAPVFPDEIGGDLVGQDFALGGGFGDGGLESLGGHGGEFLGAGAGASARAGS